jgi:formamidopyrimidine-DNA glycosylase
MPELPDILVYLDALGERVSGEMLRQAIVRSPSLLRTYEPPLREASGRRVSGVRRIGKRLVIDLDGELSLVLHLMIAGRLHWRAPGVLPRGKYDQASFAFDRGTLLLTESSTEKRSELHVVPAAEALDRFARGGLDVLACDAGQFRAALLAENHTLKRALADPALFDGIGNAYSDEILHAARLSPLSWTSRLRAEEIERLHRAARDTLRTWIDRLRAQRRGSFPEKVTAFRPEMAVHGKFRQPCPACETAVQRIRHAASEINYCPRCQTHGRILADRSLSRLLKNDWPRTIEDLEARSGRLRDGEGTTTDRERAARGGGTSRRRVAHRHTGRTSGASPRGYFRRE